MGMRKPCYVLPLVHVPSKELSRLRLLHERMRGATAYILAHPLSSFKHMAANAVDDFFEQIEALIPQEDA